MTDKKEKCCGKCSSGEQDLLRRLELCDQGWQCWAEAVAISLIGNATVSKLTKWQRFALRELFSWQRIEKSTSVKMLLAALEEDK